jgi:hypothetical protein
MKLGLCFFIIYGDMLTNSNPYLEQGLTYITL